MKSSTVMMKNLMRLRSFCWIQALLIMLVLIPNIGMTQTQCSSFSVQGANASSCQAGSYTLSATTLSANARVHKWYSVASGGTAFASYNVTPNPTAATSSVTQFFSSTTTYYVEAVCADGSITSPRKAISFTLNTPATISMSAADNNYLNLSAGASEVLTASNGTNYAWRYGTQYAPSQGTGATFSANRGGTVYVTGNDANCGNAQFASFFINYKPIADAGLNYSISTSNSTYTIYGSGSDPEGQPITYQWAKLSGPAAATLINATSPTLTVSGYIPGTYTFQLTVTDNNNASSSSSMVLTVSAVSNNVNYVQNDNVLVPVTTVGSVAALGNSGRSTSFSYMDGLGKENQAIQWQASPSGYDLVVPVEFDDLGRQRKNFLPMASTNTSGYFHPNVTGATTAYVGSEHYNFYNGSQALIPTDTKPYSDQVFEASPLGRVIQKGSVGASWQPGVAKGYSQYTYSMDSTGDVRWWQAGSSLPTSTGAFPKWMLVSVKTTNEEGITTITYTNRQGLKIAEKMKSSLSPSGYLETYYVYDNLNQLRFVLPPEFIRLYPTGISAVTVSKADVDNWCYQSVYDNFGRVVKSKVPGAGWVYQIYDNRDRVVMSQDSVQRMSNMWSYSKYDGFNRVVSSGLYTAASVVSQPSMQSTFDATQSVAPSATSYTLSSYTGTNEYIASQSITLSPGFDFIAFGATTFHLAIADPIGNANPEAQFPQQNIEKLSITFYDSYTNCSICQDPNNAFVSESWNTTSNEPFQSTTQVTGKVVGSSIKILGSTNSWINTVTYYNRQEKVIQIIGSNHLNGRDRVSSLLDFSGRKLEELQTAIGYNSGGITTQRKVFSYSSNGLLLSVKHQINSQPQIVLSAYQYNELGKVIRKNLHSTDNGATYLQSLDFRYNIRNWLTNVNNLPTGDDTNDYFGMDLSYNTPLNNAGNSPRSDGMVSAIKWRQDLTPKSNLYNFSYDNIGRLASATFKRSNNPAQLPTPDWSLQNDYYDEGNLTYDLNGNIKTLNRTTESFNGTSYTADPVDVLSYDYSTYGGNKLSKVTDGSTSSNKQLGFSDGANTGVDYTYDGNGNLSQDLNKGIASISYFFNNLPFRVTFNDNSYLQYAYDAAGIKLSETYYNAPGSIQTTTDYVGGAVYLNGLVLVINHQEGRITAPTYTNLVDNREAGSKDGFAVSGSVTIGTAYLNTETYVTATSTAASGTSGIFPIRTAKGDVYSGVKAGETYSFKVLGYQASGATASLVVTNSTGGVIASGPALPIGAANENWVTLPVTIPSGVTGIQVGVKWTAQTASDVFYINRVALYKTDFEYNYFINDQVGSTRIVLQTNPATTTYTATMELENQATEGGANGQFLNMTTSYMVASPGNHTPGGTKAILLNASNSVGPAKSIKVYPGDVIDASAYSYYVATGTYAAGTGAAMSTAVATVFSGSVNTVGDPGSIYQGISNAYSPGGSGLLVDRGTSTAPSAFLNYILFDKDYKPLSGQSVPISATSGSPQLLSLPSITAQEIGYVYIYLSYDNASGGDVYFDDLKITVRESPVIQVNAYYPFGMRAYTWLRSGETVNAYLFQGKELISKTGWHDFGSRMYYSDLGRWLGLDPKNQFASGYLGMGNIPNLSVDPDGKFVFTIISGILGFFKTALFDGGLDPTSKGARGEAWAKYDPTAPWSNTNKAFKIDMGLFQTDPHKNAFGQIWEVISRFTWQAPQTALGYAYNGLSNLLGTVKSVGYYGGATVVESTSADWGGFTLGSFINGEKGTQADPANYIFQHEYGHYLQSQSSGLAYLGKYAIPSVFAKKPHNSNPVEQDANIRAFMYFDKYEPGFNYVENGIQKTKWHFDGSGLHSGNAILGYSWGLPVSNPRNQNVLRNGILSPTWLDLLDPLGIVRTFQYNGKY